MEVEERTQNPLKIEGKSNKKNSFFENLSIGTLLTDETFLVAAAEGFNRKKINYFWMIGLNITAYLNWIIATGIGVILGSIIPDYKVLGLDFALTAMFIGLLKVIL